MLKATIGAAINVTTSYIAAKVTGQDYTWKDAADDAIIGAIATFSKVGTLVSGLGTGIKTSIDNYQNGASIGESIASGAFSAVLNIASIGNLADLGNSASEIIATSAADLVFGTGYSSLSAAVNKAVTTLKPRESITEKTTIETSRGRR